ncbi:hypothetical protein EPO56_01380 [Patescibacteria group bacterium]|nr:MAG: hypothetical protein EPO56_01380 [Patescibacteria group bacterium]
MYVGRKITLQGIIVSRRQSGEGSVRVAFYTDALGLVYALARSAREERSKLRPHLQVGTSGTFTLIKGKDVWRITGAVNTENVFFSLKSSFSKEATARVLKIVRQFVRGEGSDPYLFSTLMNFLHATPRIESELVQDAECIAVFRVLSALGYVREDEITGSFLDTTYDEKVLKHARTVRTELVQSINEGISASGL